MIKQHSWTRKEYETVYRWLRSGVDVEWFIEYHIFSLPSIKAADYSHQAYGHPVNCWSSATREKRFWEIRWRILTQREAFPF
jgi:hypothetical protein